MKVVKVERESFEDLTKEVIMTPGKHTLEKDEKSKEQSQKTEDASLTIIVILCNLA